MAIYNTWSIQYPQHHKIFEIEKTGSVQMVLMNYSSRSRRDRSGWDDDCCDDDWDDDDDGPSILRVDNCSEVDVAGKFYKQNGNYYDDCCDLENAEAPECQTCLSNTVCIIFLSVFGAVFLCCFFTKLFRMCRN